MKKLTPERGIAKGYSLENHQAVMVIHEFIGEEDLGIPMSSSYYQAVKMCPIPCLSSTSSGLVTVCIFHLVVKEAQVIAFEGELIKSTNFLLSIASDMLQQRVVSSLP